MNRLLISFSTILVVIAGLLCTRPILAAAELDPALIGNASGTKASVTDDGVVRIGWSRTDVKVTVDGMPLPPAAGLGSCDSPKVYFMHIGGEGVPEALASGVKAVWEAIRAVREAEPQPASGFGGTPPVVGELDAEVLSEIVGHAAAVNGDVAKIGIARSGRMQDVAIGGSMGLTTWAAFSGSDEHAAIDGYWGKDPAGDLARAFRGALDAQAAASDHTHARHSGERNHVRSGAASLATRK